MIDGELFERAKELGPKQVSTVLFIRQCHALMCQCQPEQFQPNCRVQNICPTMGRPVQLHFAPSADHSTACMIYFATKDEVYPGMYAISSDEWEHDSSDESDSSLPLF